MPNRYPVASRRQCGLTPVDRTIRWATTATVAGDAAVAAVTSCMLTIWWGCTGKAGRTARPVPLTVEGLGYASSTMMLHSVRSRASVPVVGALAAGTRHHDDAGGELKLARAGLRGRWLS